ncbi:MAG: helix-turn-helix transcriptional regulator [Oscillospiraceae bacterium]|nr:helix-turn-helix transcriptional regulator [Oscillospiraceae bacterium]
MNLAEQIAMLRKKFHFSQEELGEKLGVSRQAVSKWEAGQTVPELEKLKELSRIFGVSLNELLQLEESIPEAAKEDSPDERLEQMTGEPFANPASEAKLKKQSKRPLVLTAVALVLALAAVAAYAQIQISDLKRQLSGVQSELSGMRTELSATVSSLRASIEEGLEKQTSILSDYHYDVINLLPIDKMVQVKFTVTPKLCTENTAVTLSFTGADFEPITMDLSGNGNNIFEGTVYLPLSHEIHVMAAVSEEGRQTSEALETLFGFDNYLLSIYPSFDGDLSRYAISGSGSTLSVNGTLMIEVQMVDDFRYPALANYPDSGTVRMIKDGKIYREYAVDFYENTPRPNYDNGVAIQQGFYTDISTAVPMQERFAEGEWQQIEIEVTVTDRFGIQYRQTAYTFFSSGEDIDRSDETEIIYPTK